MVQVPEIRFVKRTTSKLLSNKNFKCHLYDAVPFSSCSLHISNCKVLCSSACSANHLKFEEFRPWAKGISYNFTRKLAAIRFQFLQVRQRCYDAKGHAGAVAYCYSVRNIIVDAANGIIDTDSPMFWEDLIVHNAVNEMVCKCLNVAWTLLPRKALALYSITQKKSLN